ncbi:DNA mismatch repair protein [Macleaya cordata]|uniref:DNA mismatch repair protein n=1 Tax=Macleaya cordata TaxID=56857 RepID=A0A200RE05_MACCD|nr:DNA mismatch repair protein [Macleaya cordata]
MEIEEGEEQTLKTYAKEPPKIHRLDESVVNRIAAGEVIQRPVSAVKELVENSLDASSTSVNVVVKDGGLKLIQVSDDGHGIRYEDMPILCERHTTSKLSVFEDLQTIKSMGFRGEALASMTYVSHVTVTTITKGQLHGYRVSYRDGVMEHEPKPCAAVKGTQIMIENLFYNMTARRKTLQNSADDYAKIVDLICRFAVHHINVSFSCRKHGAARADVHTVATSSRLDAIRSIYGVSVARDLMEVTASDNDPSSSVFKMHGYISNSNYNAKKMTMVLFINDRLVDCTSLKRAIEVVYAATLPKASKPFIYMSIVLPSEHVDVNVHPTKREVSLLNQESIIERIQTAVESNLRNSNSTRAFHTQVFSWFSLYLIVDCLDCLILCSYLLVGSKSQKVPVNKMVRTDSMDPVGRMHAYLQDKPFSQHERKSGLTTIRSAVRQRRNPRETADLTSVQELLSEIDCKCHSGLLDIVKHSIYVGMADNVLALLQHSTCLYLVNVVNLSKELMYQQVLRRFAHFNAIQLSDPAPLSELIMIALKEEDMESHDENDDLKQKIAEMNVELLKQKAEMLEEYFCIHIDQQGNLSRLPVILDQYTPNMDHVPEFALSLGNDVDWEDEKNCFQAISAALGNFYALHPPLLPNPSGEGMQFYKKSKQPKNSEQNINDSNDLEDNSVIEDELDHELISEAETAWAQREWSIQHVLFPSMRLFLKPPKSMATNGTFVQVLSHLLPQIRDSLNSLSPILFPLLNTGQ